MEITIPYYEDYTRVSNSSIGWFKKSPKYFKAMIDRLISSEDTKSMRKGRMIHSYLLTPDEFKKTYKILDFQTPSSQQQKQFCLDYISSKENKVILKALEAFKKNYSTNNKSDDIISKMGLEMALKYKSYIKFLRESEKDIEIISWAELNSLKVIKENVLLHKKAKELLFNSVDPLYVDANNEFHINWRWIVNKSENSIELVDCKSLIDRLIIDKENKKITLIDIKTTVSMSDFSDSFSKYDYGRQMSFYWHAITWYLEVEKGISISDYSHETFIIAIENNGNYECKVFSIDDNILIQKTTEITNILSKISWHFTNNLWDYSKEYYEGDGVESLLYEKN